MSVQLANNIKWLIESNGFKSPTAFANHVKLPQPTLFRLLVGASKEPKISTVEKIASCFGLTTAQLISTDLRTGEVVHVKPREPRREVPILDWKQCPQYKLITEDPRGMDTFPVVASRPGRNAFALKVLLDVMAPDFPERDSFIVVDPARRAENGDYVVCRVGVEGTPMGRRLIRDGDKVYLRAVNPAYPIIETNETELEIFGVVVEVHMVKKL